jgi:hypothetical protein
MKHLGIFVLLALASACGPGGSIPTGTNGKPSDGGGGPLTPANTSLHPLSTGSTWKYRVTSDVKGVFEKNVWVEGTDKVPGNGATAIRVRNAEPQLEEISWQWEDQGLVMRLREEDVVDGNLIRVTTWEPGTVKSIAESQAVNWTHNVTVHELVLDGSGGTLEDRDKTYVWTVREVNATVTVPAGTFTNVIKLERDRPEKVDKLRTYWLAPGVGKIREEGERLEELLEVNIK